MIERISATVTNNLIKNNLIEKSEIELYRFGVKRLLLFCINNLTALIVGIICGMIWQSVVFSATYIPLRRYAGGYHAETACRCYLFSSILIFGVLQLMKGIPRNAYVLAMIILIAGLIIFMKSPVESKNKKLSVNEKRAFRRHVEVILFIELLVVMGTYFINTEIALCICMAISTSAAMLVIPEKRYDRDKSSLQI